MTTTWNPIVKPPAFTTQNIVNGNFATPSNWFVTRPGWGSLDPLPEFGWAYGTNQATHVANASIFDLVQNIGVQPFTTYLVNFTLTVNAGSVAIILGASSEGVVGTYSSSQVISAFVTTGANSISDTDSLFRVVPLSTNFNGAITNIGVFTQVAIWNDISKPIGTSSVLTGYAYGLLMAITRPVTTTSDNWTRIGEPATAWTPISKAT